MWIDLDEKRKIAVLEQVGNQIGLPAFAVEKDWWVCVILKAVFQSKYADSLIFKGGTSLSKAYGLIDRFSEDIDLIIDRHLLGFDELTSNSQIKKLRRTSGGFIINEFRKELIQQLNALGIDPDKYEIRYSDKVDDTSDPNTIEIYYESVVSAGSPYIEKRVLLEMGARSLTEPSEKRSIIPFIDEQYEDSSFRLSSTEVLVVIPTRTFIEKVLLLHEEFSKPIDKIRTDRLTRHLYDLEKLMDTEYGLNAIEDHELFNTIVHHRKTVTPLRGMDYSNHKRETLNLIPPNEKLKDWESDYKTMQDNMIVGTSLKWVTLIERMREIEKRFSVILP